MDTQATTFSRDDWDGYAQSYDALLNLKPYRELRATVLQHLNLSRNDVFLDAGCGTGNLIRILKDVYPSATDVYGVDLSESMLTRAKTKCTEISGVTLMRASLSETLPFPDGMFTKIASVHVLYALPDPAATLRELHRILAPEGCLVIVTPKRGYDNGLILKAHAESMQPDSYWRDAHSSPEREAFLVREAIRDPGMFQAMLHVAAWNRAIAHTNAFHFFTEQELLDLVKSAGFVATMIASAYADQAWLVVLRKRGVS